MAGADLVLLFGLVGVNRGLIAGKLRFSINDFGSANLVPPRVLIFAFLIKPLFQIKRPCKVGAGGDYLFAFGAVFPAN